MENLYRLREERLREAHAEHVQELETRIDDLRKRLRETLAEHSKEMEEEKERRRTELKVTFKVVIVALTVIISFANLPLHKPGSKKRGEASLGGQERRDTARPRGWNDCQVVQKT